MNRFLSRRGAPWILLAVGSASMTACSAASGGSVSIAASASEDAGGGTTSGDVPDTAVFLTYHDAGHGFSIQYVQGWQVTPSADGVQIRDKDSSETVRIVPAPADITTYVSGTDITALRVQPGYRLENQDTVTVKGINLIHLRYQILSPPDPVTGNQVPSFADRYYVPGTHSLAIVSLATPQGVDNVDAFQQMIESFAWS